MSSHAQVPRRFVTVWIPDWPVVAARCEPGEPVAVVRANRIVARTPAAIADGVVVGQRRRQAQQRCPELRLVDHDPARDAREFEAVVSVVTEISPRLDVVEPGWIALGARGPSRYFGGDDALCEHLVEQVARTASAHEIGAGVADGRFASGVAARLAVRRRRPIVVDPGGAAAFCRPLPAGWLHTLGEVDADLVDLFARLGLRTLGDVAALDPVDVLGRFGPVGVHARLLATGDDPRPPSTADPAPERRLERILDDPAAQTEAVVFVAKQLADQLAGALAADGRVCTRLVVVFETENGERSERSWYRPAGLSAAAMVDRVRWQLDAWINRPRGSVDEITSGVALVRLVPDETRADEGEQLGLWGGSSHADRRAVRAIDRLTTLTSEEAVTVPVAQGGRLPAERYRWTPATWVDLESRRATVDVVAGMAAVAGVDDRTVQGPWPGRLPSPSPAAVLSDEQPVAVVDRTGAPIEVSGRGVVSGAPARIRLDGDDHEIVAWAGPWPVDQRWWDPERHRRLARFQMVVRDRHGRERACLVVAERRRWWLVAGY